MSAAEDWSIPGTAAFGSGPATSMPEMASHAILPVSQAASPISPTASSISAVSPTHSLMSVGDGLVANADRPRGKVQKRRTATSSTSSLPNPKQLCKADDWTRVKDPKEKKRIQNRVAQRTYRSRMKARLDELQAKLDSHERRKSQHHSSDSDESIRAENMAPADPGHIAGSMPSQVAGEKPFAQSSVLQQNMYEQQFDSLGSALYGQEVRYLNSPPNSESSPLAPNGFLLSPPQPEADSSVTVSQEFILDCLRFQTQLLHRLNGLQGTDVNLLAPQPFVSGEGLAPTTASGDLSGSQDAVNCTNDFMSSNLDFSFENPFESWKEDSLEPIGRHQSPLTDGVQYHSLPTIPTPMESVGDGYFDLQNVSETDHSDNTSLEERLGALMRHVERTGFHSFEELIKAYYSDAFVETSPLANEQHLNRNRRLPKLIASIFKATGDWSPWERRGFHEEILKTAERILTTETSSAQPALVSHLGPLLEAQGATGLLHTSESLLDIQKLIQQELPNSWAFAMEIASGNKSSWQEDRSKTALAAIVLLLFTGRIPRIQLLSIISACL